MKIRNTIYLLVMLSLAACNADDDIRLTPEQQSLMGQRVDFSTSMADQFVTRTTYQHNGSFNEGDQMRIFRQYATDDTGTAFNADKEIFRTYYLKMDYATGTSVSLNSDWRPMVDKLKSDTIGKTARQAAADSLTWENGKTVRFRAWGRSNLAGAISSGTKGSYYPDYTVSDWVTVSGPTKDIPLTMRHITCRIGFTSKSGNELSSAEICTDWNDYKRKDNADTSTNDASETNKTDDEAKAEAARVDSAINKMCMPAGVDDKTFLLTAMTKKRYEATADFKDFEKDTTGIVKIGVKTAAEIATEVQHPVFNGNDGRLYFMAIPINMSKENAGEELKLPACTRFKVKLRGDSGDHIFTLSDIKKENGETLFPNGLTLKAGYSYQFSVGYRYNKLTITPADSFAWTEEKWDSKEVKNETKDVIEPDTAWFNKIFNFAVKASLDNNKVNFSPVFKIDSVKQFVTFVKLSNGTFVAGKSALTRGEYIGTDQYGVKTYYWKTVDANNDTIKLTRQQAEAQGYLFYPHFYPSVSTVPAYAEEECISGAFDFNGLNVTLGDSLDLADMSLQGIGIATKPFGGIFNGNGYTLSNLNMQSGYLFDYVKDGVISNLKIESTHNTCLLNTGKKSSDSGWGCYIVGVSMLCPSEGNSIAKELDDNSSVVGCIHVGKARGALVGSATNLIMMGCMQAAAGIQKGNGTLLGSGTVKGAGFMYNYYDVELSPSTNAIGAIADNYKYDQYIRGSKSHILKAVHNYLVSEEDYAKLNENMKKEVYGLAPWTAMNKGIEEYNKFKVAEKYACNMTYSVSTEYTNRYPTLNK